MRYYEAPVMATRLGAWNLPNVTKSFIKNFWRPKKPMYVHHVWSGLGDQLVCQIMTGDHKLRSFSAIRGPKFDQCGQKEKMSCLPTSWVFCDAIKFEWKLYEILPREVWQTDREQTLKCVLLSIKFRYFIFIFVRLWFGGVIWFHRKTLNLNLTCILYNAVLAQSRFPTAIKTRGCFKNTYELLNPRALKIWTLY